MKINVLSTASTAAELPTARGVPLAGNAVQLMRDGPDFFVKIAHEFGDVCAVRLGPRRAVFINHPDLIREVMVSRARNFEKGRQYDKVRSRFGNGLLTSGGEFHLRQRRLAQPAFHRDRIARYGEIMRDLTQAKVAKWRAGDVLSVDDEMVQLTLEIVSKCLFSAKLAERAVEVMTECVPIILKSLQWRVALGIDALARIPVPANRRFDAAVERLNGVIDEVIAHYRRTGDDSGDLLSMLMLARDEEAVDGVAGDSAGDGAGMTDQQLRDEVITMLMAGHETTAASLGWVFYVLGEHPEIEARLHAEVDEVLAGRPVTMDDLPRLPYTRAVLAESLRLYPVSWMLTRRTVGPHQFASISVPAGTEVLMSFYTLHRDPRFWDDPESFVPDRWLGERAERVNRHAFLPFGAGNRQCIGESFAWAEGMIIMATVASTWRLKLAPGFAAKRQASMTMHVQSLPMTLEPRTLEPSC